MNLVIRSRLRQYALLVLSAIIVLILVTRAANNWLSYVYASDPPPRGFKEAMVLEPNNSEFYFLLAQYYDNYDFTTPRTEVARLYKKSLELNPLNYNYWFYLAEFLSRQGEKDKAVYALNQSTELSPGVVSLRWAAGMLASKLGDQQAIIENIKAVITYDQNRRQKAFIVLWQSIRNGDKILDMISDQAVPDYIMFLLSTKREIEAYKVWERHKNLIDYNRYMSLMNYLIYADEIDLAKNVWSDRMGNWDGLVWNGNFEKNIYNNGFDWTFGDKPGIDIDRIKYDKGHKVRVKFDGKENYDFYHFRQVVPVEGNTKYRFGSDLKTENITTLNGIFWEVYCLHKEGLYKRSEETFGTTDWRRVEFTFETPEGCNSVAIRLVRWPSKKTNSRFSGTVWIDNAFLEKEN